MLSKTLITSILITAVCLLLVTPASAQDASPAREAGDTLHWRLKGGGEIVGELVKETPRNVFVDIGPSIITIPTDAVEARRSLSEPAPDGEKNAAGMGTGVYDPETGSLVFRPRDGGEKILSQQEILDEVKRSVVLVSNPAGLGTGWIIDKEGRIVTNRHVVGDEAFQTVTLFVKRGDGQWVKEKIENNEVVAYSSLLDIAIVQLDMDEVTKRGLDIEPVKIAEPGSLEAGDAVYAIGNPGMGRMVLDHTISEGIASSLARNFNDVIYMQTTAAVNPGNSGGPLVNRQGEVVGLVTLKAIFQEGVAFALPVDYIVHFLKYSNAYAVTESNTTDGFRYHRPR